MARVGIEKILNITDRTYNDLYYIKFTYSTCALQLVQCQQLVYFLNSFSKSQWVILHVGTFRRIKNSQHFVVMLDCMQHNNLMCKKTVFCIHVYFL